MHSAGRWIAGAVLGAGMMLATGCASSGGGNEQKLPEPVVKYNVPAPPPRPTGVVAPALKDAARQTLLAGLRSSDPVIRMHAIEGLKESMGAAARVDLVRALADTEPMVRFAAAMACGELRLKEAEPAIRRLLNDPDPNPNPHAQIGAIFALHRLGDARYSAGLEEAMKSPTPEVRANAAFALGRLGEKSAIKILRPALLDNKVEVRLQAAEALWRLGSEDGLNFLVAAGLSAHPGHQMVGIMGLASARDERVIQHVRAGMDSEYMEVALVTARALGMLGSDEWFNLAMDGTRSSEARQRMLAALALGSIGRLDAQEALAGLLKDADEDVRIAAATAILQLR